MQREKEPILGNPTPRCLRNRQLWVTWVKLKDTYALKQTNPKPNAFLAPFVKDKRFAFAFVQFILKLAADLFYVSFFYPPAHPFHLDFAKGTNARWINICLARNGECLEINHLKNKVKIKLKDQPTPQNTHTKNPNNEKKSRLISYEKEGLHATELSTARNLRWDGSGSRRSKGRARHTAAEGEEQQDLKRKESWGMSAQRNHLVTPTQK